MYVILCAKEMISMKLIKMTDKNYDILRVVNRFLDGEIYNERGWFKGNSAAYIAHTVHMFGITETILSGEDYVIISDDDFNELCELCREVCEDTISDEKFTYLMGR